ncbi:xanthine dehydrogenase family protein molybdopterin-binding subunit [Undibacterium sp. Jales W-56]|uniref:xanthine dehydrogenase family protein molybdopterin-binding subunit n=1 Tax=Undibacterium sp. Jales W-56 TaxID=2897325 RepID=UPI0021CE3E88|nr:xanthine dehydrogenase family protein molybdopterin-binding subunit [Undibacterium sp. Jales W-56]MCU6433136.1 xanthine dehydrogenase family protein molybdopterin-binding subunit [Undibacterium sp. Jales W-56]
MAEAQAEAKAEPKKKSRRRFILGGLGVAGALVVGWGFTPPRQRLRSTHALPVVNDEVSLNGWIKIARDGSVTVAMHKSEMGQGIHTALQMLIAEELDVPLHMVKPMHAPIDKIYGNVAMLADGLPFHPDDTGSIKNGARWMTAKFARELGLQVTGGSSSVKDSWVPMREAGATARAMLLAAAAQDWGVPADQCKTRDGKVIHASGKSAGYGELAAKAANATPGEIRLKEPKEFTVIGTPQSRTDSAAKVNGSAIFGIDVRPPGLLYAAIKMSPTIGGSVKKINTDAIKPLGDAVQIIDLQNANPANPVAGVVVVGKNYWSAKKALLALPIEWNAGVNTSLSSADIFKELGNKLDSESGFTYHQQGDLSSLSSAAKTIKAEYRAPFLAHATMEPINCTAQFKDGKLDLWVSTQVPSIAVDVAAKIANISSDKVALHMTYLGGGFGRRLEVDMVVQAVTVALQTKGLPVQLIWTREEDMTHDMYRPAALARFNATVDVNGVVTAYDNKSASGSVTQQVLQRTFGLPGAGPDKTTAEGEFDMPYEFPNQKIAHVIVPTVVPLGYWRSVGHSHNAFFKESFIDELAHAAGKSPLDFRRALLGRHPRYLRVLDAAANKAGPVPEGRAHGLALHQSFGSIVAQVAEVSIKDQQIQVHKVTCAVDCGIAVNPNIIMQQIESAIIFGLSAALYGEVTIKAGQVEQSNFHDYPVLRMNEAPEIQTVIIASAEPPEGIGEPGTPPIAPAVANAVFLLTGQRLRSLPLRLENS